MNRNNVHQMSPGPHNPKNSGNGNGGGNGNLRERVASLESDLKYLATKEDMANLKAWILKTLLATVLTGMGIAASIALVVQRWASGS